MKNELTKEQSLHLLELGIPESKASLRVLFKDDPPIDFDDFETEIGTPIFTIHDLLEILPKEIELEIHESYFTLIIECTPTSTRVFYRNMLGMTTQHFLEKEFIDALYKLVCFVIKYVKEWIEKKD